MKAILEGPQIANGHVEVSGAKNSATRVLAAALLGSGVVTLRNFPTTLEDVRAKVSFIRRLGIKVDLLDNENSAYVYPGTCNFGDIDDFAVPIRTTYLLAAVGLLREGRAHVPYPGGCRIGARGYDLHLMVWRLMGCSVVERTDYIEVTGKLKGAEIDFPLSTVGGTENALLCGVIAEGETIISNAYVTPEINDLILFLGELGAQIKLEGNSLIRIQGQAAPLGSTTFSVMPDRIEALTWMMLAAATGGTVAVLNVPFAALEVPLIHLREAGINVFCSQDAAIISPHSIGADGIQPFELACGTHPGVHTDMQSFFVFLALFAQGRSIVHDFRYPERIGYANELSRMAPGRVEAIPGKIRIHPGNRPVGADVTSPDLRSSMALLMSAICSDGRSTIHSVELALRGYNKLPEKLSGLGIQCRWES